MKGLIRFVAGFFRMSEREHHATITAMNIFFGAVIGISLVSIEQYSTSDFISVLLLAASCVMAILFVSFSERHYTNIATTVVVGALLWWIDQSDPDRFKLPSKLLPTLGVWLTLAIVTGFWKPVKQPDEK